MLLCVLPLFARLLEDWQGTLKEVCDGVNTLCWDLEGELDTAGPLLALVGEVEEMLLEASEEASLQASVQTSVWASARAPAETLVEAFQEASVRATVEVSVKASLKALVRTSVEASAHEIKLEAR